MMPSQRSLNEVMCRLDRNIDAIIEEADDGIFDDIVRFAKNAYRRSADGVAPCSMEYLWDLDQHLLPTAMLMCGQNVSDHPLHFKHLEHEFERRVTPLMVRFTPNDLTKTGSFNTKMSDTQKFIVHSLFRRLTEWTGSEDDGAVDMKQALSIPEAAKIKNDVLRTFIFLYFQHISKVTEHWKGSAVDLE